MKGKPISLRKKTLPLILLGVISAPHELYASGSVRGDWAGVAWEAPPWAHQVELQGKDTRIITEISGMAKTCITSARGKPGSLSFLGRDIMPALTTSEPLDFKG